MSENNEFLTQMTEETRARGFLTLRQYHAGSGFRKSAENHKMKDLSPHSYAIAYQGEICLKIYKHVSLYRHYSLHKGELRGVGV